MPLEERFQFSQRSLQDYVDCPRRFQLRYVHRLQWPAIQAEPALENERHRRQGAALHRLIHQHLMGVSPELLSQMVSDSQLRRWWENYLDSGLVTSVDQVYPEITLSTPVRDFRLVARYDLIGVRRDGRGLIVDWKTDRRRPRRSWLDQRLQTRVYPYVLVEGGDEIGLRGAFAPGQVRMVYWFANFTSDPEDFVYEADQHQANGVYLRNLVEEVQERVTACPEGELLPRATEDSHCRFCRYRSLCRRGVRPGWLKDGEGEISPEEPFELDLDFEQIAEAELG